MQKYIFVEKDLQEENSELIIHGNYKTREEAREKMKNRILEITGIEYPPEKFQNDEALLMKDNKYLSSFYIRELFSE